MNHAPAATDFERLPWLAEEVEQRGTGGSRSLLAWSAGAALLIAGGSYRFGASEGEPRAIPESDAAPQTTVQLPEPQAAPRPWPAMQSEGAEGRMIRVGDFGGRYEAKRGWVRLARADRELEELPAVVIAGGPAGYRLQIGTTSQAHSAILCQRMRRIGQRCAIVDARADGGERG